MKATCAGQEIEISDEVAQELEEAMEELTLEQEKLIKSERELRKQKERKRWHDLTFKEKFKTFLGWDPNGKEE